METEKRNKKVIDLLRAIECFDICLKDKYICALFQIEKQSMTFYKYILIFCVFMAACENKPAKQNNNTIPVEASTTNNAKPEKPNQPKSTTLDTFKVSTVEALVENAKSNTYIILDKGTYTLNEDLVYMMSKNERKIIDKKMEQTQSIGGQLHFSGLDNIHIVGSKGTIIESKNPEAVPLFLLRCNNARVSNLTVRKKVEGKADLCYVSNSKGVKIESCTFGGGGTHGFYANKSDNLELNNCQITGCVSGAMRLNESKNMLINNSTFTNNNCKVPLFSFYGTGSSVTFNNATITNNTRDVKNAFEGSESIFVPGMNMVRINNSVIRDNPGYTKLGLGQNSLTRTELDGVAME